MPDCLPDAPAPDRFDLSRRLAAEGIGTAFLLATVVGSGIMAERLAGGNEALVLLGNTIPTGAILVVLILALGPISGAHLNPAVTLAFRMRREIGIRDALAYASVQVVGAMAGVFAAHAMFAEAIFQVSSKQRTGLGQWLAEAVAAFGLVAAILAVGRFRAAAVPYAVGLYITAAYWFTASTSFANPAVTIGRAFTDSFSGIAPSHAPAFIAAQIVGAMAATWAVGWMAARSTSRSAAREPGVETRAEHARHAP
jgi:glycerol uptake facilitator-like aquaporin